MVFTATTRNRTCPETRWVSVVAEAEAEAEAKAKAEAKAEAKADVVDLVDEEVSSAISPTLQCVVCFSCKNWKDKGIQTHSPKAFDLDDNVE